MSKVRDFIYQYEGNQREVMVYFHHLLTMELNLEEKIRFGIPFYFGRSWICYLNPIKNQKIELAFVRGNELSNIQVMLEDKGRKQISGIEFEKISDISKDVIYEIIQEAILLDETTPYKSKRKGRGK
ncbi:MAG: DUF1801 domain-containing protein [Saprospiraceae bacterium]|nr:DUF1801 domain-containing protein [Saprospiraceae bacterium]